MRGVSPGLVLVRQNRNQEVEVWATPGALEIRPQYVERAGEP